MIPEASESCRLLINIVSEVVLNCLFRGETDMPISGKMQKIIETSSSVTRMFEEGARLRARYGPDRVYDFTLGNPAVPPPPEFGEVLRNLVKEDSIPHGYTPTAGLLPVRRAVAEYLSREQGMEIPAENVVMTSGAVGALNGIFTALMDPGEEILVPAPYFVAYTLYVMNMGAVLRSVPTGGNFHLDPGAMEAAITGKTRAVLVNSPNNPSGAVYSREELEQLGEVLDRASKRYGRRIYLISDEPYRRLAFDSEVPSVLESYPHTILISSYSKQLSLAGERIGYLAVHPEAEDAEQLVKAAGVMNAVLYVNAPSLFQRVVAALQGAVVDVEAYRRRRDLVCEVLERAGYTFTVPQGGFFIFPESPIPDDITFCRSLMEERILVCPGTDFGTPGHFRLSFAVPEKTILEAEEGFRRAREEIE